MNSIPNPRIGRGAKNALQKSERSLGRGLIYLKESVKRFERGDMRPAGLFTESGYLPYLWTKFHEAEKKARLRFRAM